jgi:hypothetical protein
MPVCSNSQISVIFFFFFFFSLLVLYLYVYFNYYCRGLEVEFLIKGVPHTNNTRTSTSNEIRAIFPRDSLNAQLIV